MREPLAVEPKGFPEMLKECRSPLCEQYDVAMLDLDGVVYIGSDAVEGAATHLEAASAAGMHHAYITNNAARPPAVVAEHLRALGISADEKDIVTSAQAAARLVAGQVPAGSRVYVIGGKGLYAALAEHDLVAVQSIDEEPAAVVSGYSPDLLWRTVLDGAILVKRGLPWIASNLDLTVPTPHGPGPGNGVLVEAVGKYAGRRPVVAGKPEQPLFEETSRRVGGNHRLVVGDRLDTDIAGAVNSGLDSLLVLTGVTGLSELAAATADERPSYISRDLAGLSSAHPIPTRSRHHSLNGWHASVSNGKLVIEGAGDTDDWWRVVASASWEHLDAQRVPVDTADVTLPA